MRPFKIVTKYTEKGLPFIFNICSELSYWVMYFISVRPSVSLVAMSLFDIGLKLSRPYYVSEYRMCAI